MQAKTVENASVLSISYFTNSPLYIRQTLQVMQASPSLDAPFPADAAMHVGPEYPGAAAAGVP